MRLARSNGEVVDGHLRLKAAQKLSITQVPVIWCDEWTPTQVKAFRFAKYRRLQSRLGPAKAITAMAHHLARLFYRMIKYGSHYLDHGMAAYEERFREQQLKWLARKAAELKLYLSPVPVPQT